MSDCWVIEPWEVDSLLAVVQQNKKIVNYSEPTAEQTQLGVAQAHVLVVQKP